MSTKTFLSTVFFSSLTNWSIQYLMNNDVVYCDRYVLTKIKSFLTRSKIPVEIEDNKNYKRVTIKTNNGGVFLRDIENGKNIGTKKQFIIKEGQFILSKIDARNGAFGVANSDVDGAIITGNFWAFDVEDKLINPHFLSLITTTPSFIRFSENASNGTTNRHYLQEKAFLDQEIPLPSLEEQNKIVEAYNIKIKQAEEAEREAEKLETEIENYIYSELGIKKQEKQEKKKGLQFVKFSKLDLWGVRKNNNVLGSFKYQNTKLSDVSFINPLTNLKELPDDLKMSFIPMECISDIYGEILEKREGKKSLSKGYTKFQDEDLIWARITPCMQNGKSAVVRDLVNGYGYGSTEYHVIRKRSHDINIDYIYSLLRLKSVLSDAQNHFTGSAGQQRVPKSYLENLLIPFPPLSKQNEIMEHITSLKEQIKILRNQAEQNRQQAIKNFENTIFN